MIDIIINSVLFSTFYMLFSVVASAERIIMNGWFKNKDDLYVNSIKNIVFCCIPIINILFCAFVTIMSFKTRDNMINYVISKIIDKNNKL